MESIKQALKSKTVWFGILNEFIAVIQFVTEGGELTAGVIYPAVVGAVTILLRAVTNEPLSAK